MTASKHRLGNLVAIVDRNHLKAMDAPECSKTMDPMAARWASFGWAVRECDGHDVAAICDALDWTDSQSEKPSLIIADTIKGKGVSFIEGQAGFHNGPLTEEQFRQALAETKAGLARAEAQ
jgi:transketolase